MNQNLIFIPMLLQVLLTLVVYALLAVAKSRAIKNGEVDLARRALHADAWPDSVIKISNNVSNQFQAPVLFYVLAFLLYSLQAVGTLALIAAWGFTLSRLLHAAIHIGPNYVPARKSVFILGLLCLLVLTSLSLIALF